MVVIDLGQELHAPLTGLEPIDPALGELLDLLGEAFLGGGDVMPRGEPVRDLKGALRDSLVEGFRRRWNPGGLEDADQGRE